MEKYVIIDEIFSKDYRSDGKTVVLVLDKPYPLSEGNNVVVIGDEKFQFILPNLKNKFWIEIESDKDYRNQSVYFERIEDLSSDFTHSYLNKNVGYW